MENITQIEKIKRSYKIEELLRLAGYYFIAAVLLFSGIAKIIDPVPLINTLKLIKIIPESLHILIATLLPVIEICFALLLLMKIKPKIALKLITLLFSIFLGFSIYGAIAGYGTDCGCFGNTVKSSFGLGMIIRNTVFLIISFILMINSKLSITN